MPFAVTSFAPSIVDLPLVPKGWFDSGKVRGQVYFPERTRWGPGPHGFVLHTDYGGFLTSQKITVIDDGGTPGLLLGALNAGKAVVTLEVNEGSAAYLAGRGKGLLKPVNDANGWFLNPNRPDALKDIWGAFTWLKRYGLPFNLDWRRGNAFSTSSAGGVCAAFCGHGANRAGRYAALETDACLAEEDSRPNCFVYRLPHVRFRTYKQTITGAAFADLTTDPTGETAAVTLADSSATHQDELSTLLTGATFNEADHEAAVRMWTYMFSNEGPDSVQYLHTVSGDFINDAVDLHDVWQQRAWRAHYGYPRTRAVIGGVPTINTSLDSAQIANPEPSDGSSTDMLDFLLAHFEG